VSPREPGEPAPRARRGVAAALERRVHARVLRLYAPGGAIALAGVRPSPAGRTPPRPKCQTFATAASTRTFHVHPGLPHLALPRRGRGTPRLRVRSLP